MKRNGLAILFTCFALLAASSSAQAQARRGAGDTTTHAAQARAGRREPHPRIRAAIRALQGAKAELNAAAHDFGGHRADALKAVDEAIAQLQAALAYDRK